MAIFLTLPQISLQHYGIQPDTHASYLQQITDLGATPSPITLKSQQWANMLVDDHYGAQVMQHVALGAQIEWNDEIKPFQVDNYVPDELQQWVMDDLVEEQAEGRFAPVQETSPGIWAAGLASSLAII